MASSSPVGEKGSAEQSLPAAANVANASLERDPRFVVSWDGPDDPQNPQNWSRNYRWFLTFWAGTLTLNATFASSAPTGNIPDIAHTFGFGQTVGNLMIGIFILGYCVGPLVWGPASETYGRRPVFLVSFFVYTMFQLACAVAPNTGALLVFRFIGGCFAASALTNSGAIIADIWDPKTRGRALAIFAVAPFAGPALGPIVSGFISASGTSWRILFWVLFAFAAACGLITIFAVPETFSPIILRNKARALRKSSGDERWYAPIETTHLSFGERAKGIVMKPWKVMFSEPVLLAVTIYTSFIYGVLYLCFEAFPIIYVEGHGLGAGLAGLTFLPLFVGGVFGGLLMEYHYNPKYAKLVDETAPHPVPPEARLPMSLVGASLFTVSLFWIGWTSYPSVSIWAPIVGTLPLGVGILLLFLSLINYIIDIYLQVAATALAANTVMRSIFGATFPLFASSMYQTLNPRWASTLLGCISLVMIPIPLLFMRYGPWLRSKSRYSPLAERAAKTGV